MTFLTDSAVRGPARPLFDPDTRLRVIRTYCRTVGAIQLLYASYLGWAASDNLRWAFHQICQVARNGFRFEGQILKNIYVPSINIDNLAEGAILALLALYCLVGGCALLKRLPWARGWAITYLILLTAYAVATFPIDMQRGHDLRGAVYAYLGLALPYLPLLFISLTDQVVSVDKAKPSGLGVDDLAG